jgi:aryl-alcohol dehydrogenase-like predicted oxidoreductase
MISRADISGIGFGSYRISLDSKEHEQALAYALQSGCNLIDTASNYSNGDSEKLIGKVLQQTGTPPVFLITKAGYISYNNLAILQKLNEQGKGLHDVVHVSEHLKHSIHPEYLEAQMETSLRRLNRKYLDGFLLHSPEYYFKDKSHEVNPTEYYSRIQKAFEFLEEKVKQGIIRYYGVSSNTLTVHKNEPDSTNLHELIKAAKRVSSSNHFKLIQFPFNIMEQDACRALNDGKSLSQTALDHDITTLGNRPLNANSASGLLRLVIHSDSDRERDPAADDAIYEQAFGLIEEQLKKMDPDAGISDIAILSFLKDNWRSILNPDAFDKAFHELFYPFVNYIFEDEIPAETLRVIKQFEDISRKYHLRTQSESVIAYLKSQQLNHLLENTVNSSLPQRLCSEYLKAGISSVLAGMRKPEYVDDYKSLFSKQQAQ